VYISMSYYNFADGAIQCSTRHNCATTITAPS
jgi:hypothetical protein